MIRKITLLKWLLTLLVVFLLISCTDKDSTVVNSVETISEADIVGTWKLNIVKYDSSRVEISLDPSLAAYSLTLKFRKDHQGQILSFDSGNTTVQNINWNIQGNVIILISEDNNSEYIRCEMIDECLCLNYSYTTLTGKQVLALYIFTKEE